MSRPTQQSKRGNSYTAVKGSGKMRFNKNELTRLAAQPSHKFEKEGVLFIKEKQEGFFLRKSEKNKSYGGISSLSCYGGGLIGFGNGVLVERWCRLRGNLLFYFKSRDHWSEPAGVIVVENCIIEKAPDNLASPHEATYGILIIFGNSESTNSKTNEPYRNRNEHNDHQCINQNNQRPISSINKQQVQYQQHIACNTENERCEWILALQSASHRSMKQNLDSLRNQLRLKMEQLGLDAKTAASLENPHSAITISPSNSSLSNISASSISQSKSSDAIHERTKQLKQSTSDNINASTFSSSSNKSPVIKDLLTEIPLMEMCISCDNLLCDALGRAPSCRVVVYWRNLEVDVANKDVANSDWLNNRRKSLKDASHKTDSIKLTENIDTSEAAKPKKFEDSLSGTRTSQPRPTYHRQHSNPVWQKYSMTEIVEKSSNPTFLRTTIFREADGVNETQTELKLSAYDIRERFTATSTLLGTSTVLLHELKNSGRTRLKLSSPNPDGRTAGFVTLSTWGFDITNIPGSSESTPFHTASFKKFQNEKIMNTIKTSNTPCTGDEYAVHLHNDPNKSDTQNSISSMNDEGLFKTTDIAKMKTQSGQSKTPPEVVSPTSTIVSLEDKIRSDEKHQRRSHSLPPRAPGNRSGRNLPNHASLGLFFAHPNVATYQFHSGLGGDITVNEVMVESKLSFAFPQQLLSLWICEEKELVHEIAGLGELKSPWHANQMAWLENHLNLINTYSQALENLDNCKDTVSFRLSTQKGEKKYEFVPTNLHLQRMWVVNDSLRKSGFYDTFTHGAFTSFGQKSPGLIKMLKELKAPQKDSQAWCNQSDHLQMAEDILAAVRRVRREVVDCMRVLMKYAKEKDVETAKSLSATQQQSTQVGYSELDSDIPIQMVEEMLKKTKCLCSLIDSAMVEEIFEFLEMNRITAKPEKDEFAESVAEFMKRNRMKINLPKINCSKQGIIKPFSFGSLTNNGNGSVWQTPCTEFISKELRTPEVSDNFYASSPANGQQDCVEDLNLDNLAFGGKGTSGNIWKSYSAYTSGYQSVDHLSDIDEFEENFKYLSVVDKTRHYYTLCNAAPPIDTPPIPGSPISSNQPWSSDYNKDEEKDDGLGEEDKYWEEEFEVKEDNPNADEVGSYDDAESKSNDTIINTLEDQSKNGLNEDTNDIIATKTEDTKYVSPNDSEKRKKEDQGIMQDSPSGLHYRAGDEPEPIDLTRLNIEAAMMCLASKVRLICGKSDSPSMSSRTFRFKEVESRQGNNMSIMTEPSWPSASSENRTNIKNSDDKKFDIEDVITTVARTPKRERCHGNSDETVYQWANELRPSMRKLRQGMDSLCKTARLICSVIRLQQKEEAVELSHAIKYRRDVCFSQALTSLVSSLMARFWCLDPPDITFLNICRQIGPLVTFESLLSLHGEDVTIFNDMIVAVEDLRNVEFTLVIVDNKPSPAHIKNDDSNRSNENDSNQSPSANVPLLACHSFPLPRVTGSRNNLKVMIPVPNYILTHIPIEELKHLSFSITPVLFNIGINEHATLAGKFGNNGPQEKNNLDNFKTMSEYYRRYKKLDLPTSSTCQNGFGGKLKRGSALELEPQVQDLLSILKNEVHNRKNKNVEVLQLAENITRRINGIRFTCCKSGKDRTGMSSTLEQVQILSREYDLAEHEYQRALDTMRSEGTRRDNVEKNIGKRIYAFNGVQRSTLPAQYQPPVGTFGKTKT